MSLLDLLDTVNVIDRLGGAIYGLGIQRQSGRVIRVRHSEDGEPPTAGYELVEVLARYSISSWSYLADSKGISFRVRSGQWQWAVDLLTVYGAPVQHVARAWTRKPGVRMPPPWSETEKERR